MAQLLIKGTKVAEVVGDTTSLIANTLYHPSGTQIITDDGGTVGLTNVNLQNINFDNVANDSISGDKIHGGTISNSVLDSSVSFPSFVGMIASFGMSSPPTGWLVCNGAQYAIADYGDLYTAIGTTWGALTNGSDGAGSTHFRVPDLQGAFLRGAGTGSINGRNKTGTLNSVGDFNEDQYQGHIHQFTGYDKDGNGNNSTFAHSGSGTIRTGLAAGNYVGDAEINSQGTPRTGVETFPYNASIQYCIKY